MCGFVGFADHIHNKRDVLTNMMNAIIHRGPDSAGTYIDDQVALGFRRLSIIDLGGGDQPLYNEDNSVVLVFNGEIYNYQELRPDLVEKGHRFRTESDSEVLIHLYEQYGTDMLNKLRGMFAFVIWDQNKELLFMAHDYFGIKPLYYAQMGNSFLFASEIKAFLHHPNFKKELNLPILEQYLSFQYSPCEETFFKNVYKLPPAHYLTCYKGKIEVKRYWEPKFQDDNSKDLDGWVEEITKVMKDSVAHHKIADVEVGSFLSSGVDSSYVACLAKVDKTFTVGFGEDERYNEIGWAKEFSQYINVQNINHIITPEEYWDNLGKIQYHMDEPLADPAAVALYFVSREAAKHVKVALSGEGADEFFGGYNIYREPLEHRGFDIIPLPIRRALGWAADRLPHIRGLNFIIRHSKTLQERYIGNAFIFDEVEKKKLLKRRVATFGTQDITRPFFDKVRDKDPVTQMQYLDIHLWMAYDILLKADKMSMANSLEVRVPFLDRKVLELAQTIPQQYRVQGTTTKLAMRKAAEQVIPQKTADKKKLGFPVPIRVWLKQDKYYNLVKGYFTSATASEFFNSEYLVQLLDQHRAGSFDNSRKIWTVFMFLKWYEEFFIKR